MSVKMRYNILTFCYYVVMCSFAGFVAVFLQYKGVSNTQIGLVTGTGCVASIFGAPFFSNLIIKKDNLTVKKMIYIVYSILCFFFVGLVFLPLPVMIVIIMYTLLHTIYLSSMPFLQMMASDYLQAGIDVDFGVARGLGSTAWALTSLSLGFLIDYFSPTILAYVMILFVCLTFFLLRKMPEAQEGDHTKKQRGSIFSIIIKYPVFSVSLLGMGFMLAAATSLGTYLINIVKNIGGDTSFFGIAVFLMALSEMPVMAISTKLMSRFKSINLIAFAAICYVLRNYIICLAPNIFVLCCGMLLQGVSFGLLTAVFMYYVIFNLASEDQTNGQTLIIMLTTGFGSMIGNLLGGILQDSFGLGAMYMFVYIMTILGAMTMLTGWLMSKKDKYKKEVRR